MVEHLAAPDAPIVWTDASQKSLRLDRVKVRVDRADYGEVRGKDARNTVIVSGENYLILTLNVQNQRGEPIEYRSWYGGQFASPAGPRFARLTDSKGRPFEMIQFGDVSRVKGHTAEASLSPNDEVEDVLIFVIPPEVKRELIPHFKLELPAEAVGVEGTFRFEVPRDMIIDFHL